MTTAPQPHLNKPYLSIIVTGRNDNYGGDFYERIQNQLTWTTHLAEKYKIPTEYIIVNYNPIENEPTLLDVLKWNKNRQYLSYRILTVPTDVHQLFVNPEVRKTIPLFEFIGKNAAIRRARGDFILTSNADIIFDPGIFRFLGKKHLSPNSYYRADRCDYHPIGSLEGGHKEMLQAMRANVFKYFLRGDFYESEKWSFATTLRLFRLRSNMAYLARLVLRELDKTSFFNIRPILIQPETFVHCNAGGDFMLMSKENYHQLRGFPEDSYISTHVDSLMVYMAHTLGLREQILSAPVYHQDHERRFIVDKKEEDPDVMRMYDRLQNAVKKMIETKHPHITNDENWGLNNHDLPDCIF